MKESNIRFGRVGALRVAVARLLLVSLSLFSGSALAAAPSIYIAWVPDTITLGEETGLYWNATGANSCVLNGVSVAVSGQIGPAAPGQVQTTTHTLKCWSPDGEVEQQSTTLRVLPAPEPAPTVTASFSPNPGVYGSSSTLTWSSTNATSCSIPGNSSAAANGSRSYPINTTSNWNTSVTCTGAGGSTTRAVTLQVTVPAPTLSVGWTPPTITVGEPATFSWNSTNTDSCTLNGGAAATSDSISGYPSASATWTVSCSGPGGSINRSATLTVNQPKPTVTASFSPNPGLFGSNSTLTWSSTNATSCSIPGNGSAAANGSRSYPINTTSNWNTSVTCTGAGGSTTRAVTLQVTVPAPTLTVGWTPPTITEGELATFSWTSTNADSCTLNGGAAATSDSISGYPSANATWTVYCSGPGGTINRSATLGVNQPPNVAQQIPNLAAQVGQNFTYTFPASTFADPNGDALTYSASKPSWLSFNAGARRFTGTPPASAGNTSANVTVTASDGRGGAVSDTFSISIASAPNDPPSITWTGPANLTDVALGSNVTLSANATDPQNNINRVEFFVDGVKVGQDTTAPYAINWTATLGGHEIYASVVDAENLTDSTAVVIVTVAPNTSNLSISNTVNNYDGNYTLSWNRSSNANEYWILAEKDGVVLGFLGLIHQIFDNNVTSITSTALQAATGLDLKARGSSYRYAVRACETTGPQPACAPFVWQSISVLGNRPPEVAQPMPDRSVEAGQVFSYTFPASTFTDGDGDALTYSATKPAWLNFNAGSRSFSGTAPAGAGNSSVVIRVTATDPGGASATDDFTLTITEPNTSPSVTWTGPADLSELAKGASVTLSANATDAQNNVARVEFYVDGVKVGEDTTSPYAVNWTASLGGHEAYARAVDTGGLTATTSPVVRLLVPPARSDLAIDGSGDSYGLSWNQSNDANEYWILAEKDGTVLGFLGLIHRIYDNTDTSITSAELVAATGLALEERGHSYRFAVRACDTTGPQPACADFAWQSFTIIENRDPVVAEPLLDHTANPGEFFSYLFPAGTFTDLDGDSLSYSSDAPAWLIFNSSTRSFYGTAPEDAADTVIVVSVTASDGYGGSVTDSFNIEFSGINTEPSITWTGPADLTEIDKNGSAVLSADVIDAQDNVSRVEFYVDGAKVGEDTTVPYAFTWNAVLGGHRVYARAVDAEGLADSTAEVRLYVAPSQSDLAITRTVDGYTLAWNQSDDANEYWILAQKDGTFLGLLGRIHRIYDNTDLDITSDELIAATGLALEDLGHTYSYAVRSCVTTSPEPACAPFVWQEISFTENVAPEVTLLAPVNPEPYQVGDLITISADVSDIDNNLSSVEFLIDGSPIATLGAAPFETQWTATAGGHEISVRAVDSLGAETTTDPLLVLVPPETSTLEVLNTMDNYGDDYTLRWNLVDGVDEYAVLTQIDGAWQGVFGTILLLPADELDLDGDGFAEITASQLMEETNLQLLAPAEYLFGISNCVVTPQTACGRGNDVIFSVLENTDPELVAPIPDQEATPGELFTLTIPEGNFNDPDEHDLEFTVTAPEWLSFDSSTLVLSGIPPQNAAATSVLITVTASDGYGGIVSTEFLLTIESDLPAHAYYFLDSNFTNRVPNVYALLDGTEIELGAASFTANAGDLVPVGAVNQGDVLFSNHPLSIGSADDATDMPVPGKFAGTEFAMPQQRGTHTYYVATTGSVPASFSFDDGSGVAITQNVAPGEVLALTSTLNGNVATISGATGPLVVSHRAGGSDAYPVPPASQVVIGIRTNSGYFGSATPDATVDVYTSSGATLSSVLAANTRATVGGTGGNQGAADAAVLSSLQGVAAVSHADSDGSEQAGFWPLSMLAEVFILPVSSQYVAVACVGTEPVTVSLYGPAGDLQESSICSPADPIPGKAYLGLTTNGAHLQQGSRVVATAPIYMMYEDSVRNDEKNLAGAMLQSGSASLSLGSVGTPVAGDTVQFDLDVSGFIPVQRVELFIDGVPGPVFDAPLGTIEWQPTVGGSYVVEARVTDTRGNTFTSAPQTITVADEAPTVTVLVDATGPITLGESVVLSASASDDVAVVETALLVNGAQLTSSASDTVSTSWTPTAPGIYSIQAQATDNEGAIGLSAPQMVEVQLAMGMPDHAYYFLDSNFQGTTPTVYALVDNTELQFGASSFTANAGDLVPIGSVSQGDVIFSNHPLSIGSSGNAMDTPVPGEFAGTEFAIPQQRGTHTYFVAAPGSMTVSFSYDDGSGIATTQSVSSGEVVSLTSSRNGTVAKITGATGMLVVSHRAGGSDAYPVPPVSTEVLGIRTNNGHFGTAASSATVDVFTSSGWNGTSDLTANLRGNVGGLGGRQGTADAAILRSAQGVAGVSIADSDGGEQTGFWPLSMLAEVFILPANTQYVAMACVGTDAVSISLYSPTNELLESAVCSPADPIPGKAYLGLETNGAHIPQGSRVVASAPIYLIYEDAATNDERNLAGGMLSAGSATVSVVSAGMPAANQAVEFEVAVTGNVPFARIDLLIDGVAGPYVVAPATRVSWIPDAGGSYVIEAQITDELGNVFLSTPLTLNVAGQAPEVTLFADTAGAIALGGSIDLSAYATDDVSVTDTALLVDGSAIASAAAETVSATWTPTATGTYSLQGQATDNDGVIGVSEPVTVRVDAPGVNVAPQVNLSPSAIGNLTLRDSVTFTVDASDADGTVAVLELLINGSVVASATDGSLVYPWSPSVTGEVSITARASDDDGYLAYGDTVVVTVEAAQVSINDAPAPAPMPSPGVSTASDQVGAIAGSFSVTPAGAATYSMPFTVAPGTAGVTPQLGLSYSSSAGNGVAGVGMSVSGLSSITRCRQTLQQDGAAEPIRFDEGDRFCLDGQRLIKISSGPLDNGSEFRTEIDSYRRITVYGDLTADGNPDGFKVEGKDGSITYYGKVEATGNDARHELYDMYSFTQSDKVMSWHIAQFEDSLQNRIVFEYDDRHNLDRVSYAYGGGTTTNTYVEFVYDPRDDEVVSYVSGYKMALRDRLKRVTAYNDGLIMRQYWLSYLPQTPGVLSRLQQVQECVSGVCKQPTTFEWSSAAATSTGYLGVDDSPNAVNSKYLSSQPADLNGDGYMDLLWVSLQTSGEVELNASMFDPDTNTFLKANCTDVSTCGAPERFELKGASLNNWRVVDFNGDGSQDVVIVDKTGGNKLVKVLLTRPGVSPADFRWGHLYNTGISLGSGDNVAISFSDVDSNGLPDLIYQESSGGATRVRMMVRGGGTGNCPAGWPTDMACGYLLSSTPYEFVGAYDPATPALFPTSFLRSSHRVTDFDGDGRVDFFVLQDHYCDTSGTEPGLPKQEAACNSSLIDNYLAWRVDDVDHDAAKINVSLFDWSYANFVYQREDHELVAADLNGDGLGDFLYEDNGTWWYQISTGAEFGPRRSLGALTDAQGKSLQIVDVNRDGYSDLVVTGSDVLSVYHWDQPTHTFAAEAQTLITTNTDGNREHKLIDVNGDTYPDWLEIQWGSDNKRISLRRASSPFEAHDKITHIDNGLGLENEVTYAGLKDPAYPDIYTKDTDGHEPNWNLTIFEASVDDVREPTFDIIPSTYLVREICASSPAAGETGDCKGGGNAGVSRQTYSYAGAKLQAGGRGFLGFREMRVDDLHSDTHSITEYRQDFPYSGRPRIQRTYHDNGRLLSQSASNYARGDSVDDRVYNAYLWISSDEQYDPDAEDSLSRTVTSNWDGTNHGYDTWGNLLHSEVEHFSNGETVAFATVVTQNDFGSEDATRRLGRLQQSTVTHARGTDSVTRTSSFTYYDSTQGPGLGLLKTESVSGTNGEGTVSLATTTHGYDVYGNKNHVAQTGNSTAAGVPQTREQFWEFPDGRYLSTEMARMGGQIYATREVLDRDPVLGLPTIERNLSGVVTTTQYGVFGRRFFQYQNTGIWFWSRFRTGDGDCPTGTAYVNLMEGGDGGDSIVCFDALGREVRTGTVGFAGGYDRVDTIYDVQGRVLSQSNPYNAEYDGANETSYDIYGRAILTTAADGTYTRYDYSGLTVTTTNARGQVRTETRNGKGELVQASDNGGSIAYFYEAAGNLARTTINTGISVTTTLTYDALGRKVEMVDPDKGTWSYNYNQFGELVLQTNAKFETTSLAYDDAGRKVSSVDRDSSSNIRSSTTWIYDSYGTETQPGELIYVDHSDSYASAESYAELRTYDAFGRPSTNTVDVSGLNSIQRNFTYDEHGRPFQVYGAADTHAGVEYEYNTNGYRSVVRSSEVIEGAQEPQKTWYSVESVDPRGNQTQVKLFTTPEPTLVEREYERYTGYLKSIFTSDTVNTYQSWSYDTYDQIGNLEQVSDIVRGNTYEYAYDKLNRLTTETVDGTPRSFTYAFNGNISNKDGQAYSYGSSRPHAVTQVGDTSYSYDANGNMFADGTRRLLYTVFDKPVSVTSGSDSTRFAYGPERGRFKQVSTVDGKTTRKYYVAGLEILHLDNGTWEYRMDIDGVAQETFRRDAQNELANSERFFFLRNHLGSVDVILNEGGFKASDMHFDAWGDRRNADNVLAPETNLENVLFVTDRGYTGHEMMDAFGLIHMNGRVYDARIGRFLSADPFVQFPNHTQSYNRYSYVLNNPLRFSDPSGYFLKNLLKNDLFRVAAAVAVGAFTYNWAMAAQTLVAPTSTTIAVAAGGTKTISTIGLYSTAGFGATTSAIGASAVAGATSGFVGGAILSGSLKGAVQGAFTGAVTGGVGAYTSTVSIANASGIAKRVGASALGGCIAGSASGGSCRKGAQYAAFAQSLNIAIEKFTGARPTYRTPSNKGGVYKPSDPDIFHETYCIRCDVVDPNANNIGLGIRANGEGAAVGTATKIHDWYSFAEGSPASRALASIPGFNSGAVFHDVLVGTIERSLGIHTLPSFAGTALGLVTNQATILPAIGVNYISLGAGNLAYYGSELSDE